MVHNRLCKIEELREPDWFPPAVPARPAGQKTRMGQNPEEKPSYRLYHVLVTDYAKG